QLRENTMYSQTLEGQDSNNKPNEIREIEEQITFQTRQVLVFGEINDKQAYSVSRRLLALSHKSSDPITLILSSPGGHVESGDVIHDMIHYIDAPVTIVGTGWVGSAAAHIFLSPPIERRLCLPNTRFLIHQPAGGAGGPASDIAIQAEQIVKTRERIARVIARQTGQPLDRVMLDIERDFWMNTEQAISYGLVSRVINHQSELF
ncbi:MAG: ATP-dependent Clp protease proteolytic subunit, partial [Exilibacterium sp.]